MVAISILEESPGCWSVAATRGDFPIDELGLGKVLSTDAAGGEPDNQKMHGYWARTWLPDLGNKVNCG